jgi:hypothetical protein
VLSFKIHLLTPKFISCRRYYMLKFTALCLIASCVESKWGRAPEYTKENILHCKHLLPQVFNGLLHVINPYKPEVTFDEVKERVTKLLTAIPPVTANTPMLPGFDPHSPEMYYRFLTYSTLAYCTSSDDINTFASHIGPDFYTGIHFTFSTGSIGEFQLMSRTEQSGGKWFKDKDAVYIITRNDKQKLITLAWRGSKVKTDFMCDSRIAHRKGALALPFAQQCPLPDAVTELGGLRDFYASRGFSESLPLILLEQIKEKMIDAHNAYPDYQIVITGHSLGGVKAVFTAMLLKEVVPVAAIYTFGQMPFGSKLFANYAMNENCIDPKTVVRVVSRADLAPWGNIGSETGHSELVNEVFAPDPNTPGLFKICKGGMDTSCSASVSCKDKTLKDHSVYAGFNMKDMQRLIDEVRTGRIEVDFRSTAEAGAAAA